MYKYLAFLLLLILVVITLQSCAISPSDPGKLKPNSPPEVFFLNTYSEEDTTIVNYSEIIYWYGTDSDGFVEEYQLLLEEPYFKGVTTTGDSIWFLTPELMEGIPDSIWEKEEGKEYEGYFGSGEYPHILRTLGPKSATQDTINFTAPKLENIHRLWLRAKDNRNGYSDIIFEDFLAKTKPPETTLLTFMGEDIATAPKNVFSLKYQTPTWGGLTFTWEGKDPDGSVVAYYIKFDDNREGYLVSSDNISLRATDLSTGEHTIYISARDDAGAYDPTPAQYTFNVVIPTFEKDVLLLDDTPEKRDIHEIYYNNSSKIPFDPSVQVPDYESDKMVDRFYTVLMDSAHVSWDTMSVKDGYNYETFGKYKMVIMYQENGLLRLFTDQYFLHQTINDLVVDYMKAGGSFWYIGYGFNINAQNIISRSFEKLVGLSTNGVSQIGNSPQIGSLITSSTIGQGGSDTMYYEASWPEVGGLDYYPVGIGTCNYFTLQSPDAVPLYYARKSNGSYVNDKPFGYGYFTEYYNFIIFGTPLINFVPYQEYPFLRGKTNIWAFENMEQSTRTKLLNLVNNVLSLARIKD